MNKEYDIVKIVDNNGNIFNLENIKGIHINEYNKIVFPDGFIIDLKNAKAYYTSNDNANPSEALECLERLEYYHIRSVSDLGCKEHRLKDITTIKQALLKAEKEHNSVNLLMQELDCKDFAELRKYARCGYEKINKHYLKWEDLDFDDEWKYQEVKLNGTKYTIKYKCGFDFFDNYYEVVKIYNKDKRKQLFTLYNNEQFFNDLHLERVEE